MANPLLQRCPVVVASGAMAGAIAVGIAAAPAAALDPPACPRIGPAGQDDSQPLRLTPSQVPLKNRLSCLSPADAVYGPDGCPLRLCPYPQTLELPVQLPPP